MSLVIGIMLAATGLSSADDSVYEGKTLKQWVGELEARDAKARLWAIMTIAEIGPDAHQAVPPLIECFKDKRERLRYKASEAVGKIGPKAIPLLVKSLESDNVHVRRWSAYALGEMHAGAKEAIPALLEAVKDQDSKVRAAAVAALGAMGPAAKTAIPAGTRLLRDEDSAVRRSAAVALWYIDRRVDGTLNNLIEGIRDDDHDPVDRIECIQIIGTMAPKSKRAVGSLVQVLADRRPEIRVASAKALLQLGPEAVSRAITYLVRMIIDKKTGNDDRRAAGDALVEIGADAVEGMLRLLRDDDPDVRELGAVLLGRMATRAKAAITPLTRALNDDEDSVRQAAGEALKKIDPDAAAKAGIK
jgi:HEAT repeat protein